MPGTSGVMQPFGKGLTLGIAACVGLSASCVSPSVDIAVTAASNVEPSLFTRSSSPGGETATRPALAQSEPKKQADEESGDAEDLGDDDVGRSFLYKELVFSGFYSFDGVTGVPPDDQSEDHFELSPRPPGNYLGLEYIRTFTSASSINKTLPDWLQAGALDLHPRLVFDRLEESNDADQIKFAPQDFWIRFNLAEVDRLTLRVGQFVLPYGVNPILAPRQQFILPLESTDLGLKWDWGIDVKGPIGRFDWEIAATIGSGEALHSPQLFRGSDRTSYLISGRIGTPTYWDLQYGVSFLFGDLPVIRGAKVVGDEAISRWRVGVDTLYKYGTYLMAGAQVTFGQDGFAGDEEFVTITGGNTAEVLGYRTWVDWVLPSYNDIRLSAQFESVIRDLSTSHSDDTAMILELAYSLTTLTTLRLDYRAELNRSVGDEDNAIFLTFIYYGL